MPMFGLSPQELLLVFLLVLLLFGAKKIPEIARALGKSMREFKKGVQDINDEIEKGADDATAKNPDSKAPSQPAPGKPDQS
jgi:sec-independent protein translocase protein TatA